MNENMKKIVNVATPAFCAVALVLSVAAFNKTNAATASAPAPVVSSAPAGQPVDLTLTICRLHQVCTEFKDPDCGIQ